MVGIIYHLNGIFSNVIVSVESGAPYLSQELFMPKFKCGDHVERIGTLVPIYMRNGVVIRVIPNKSGVDWLNEYEVDFGNHLTAKFYET